MIRRKRNVPEINSSSTADIAFLLLTFFLITTSMDPNRGLPRRLPAPTVREADPPKESRLKARNILRLSLDAEGRLTCNDRPICVEELRQLAKDFIANPDNAPDKPEKQAREIPFFGTLQVTGKHVIALECDRDASYNTYIAVQNELVAAYNELRDELSQKHWHQNYAALSAPKQEAVRMIYPQAIAEAVVETQGGTE